MYLICINNMCTYFFLMPFFRHFCKTKNCVMLKMFCIVRSFPSKDIVSKLNDKLTITQHIASCRHMTTKSVVYCVENDNTLINENKYNFFLKPMKNNSNLVKNSALKRGVKRRKVSYYRFFQSRTRMQNKSSKIRSRQF